MTKSIASYPKHEQRTVIERRLRTNTRGMGYWAARAAADKLGIATPSAGPFKKRDPRPRRTQNKHNKKHPQKQQPNNHKPFKQAFAS